MGTYQVSANGQVFGTYEADSEQGARDLCAQDAGYKSEADMVSRLEQSSELVAVEIMATIKRVNERGIQALKIWIEAASMPDHCHTDAANLDAWCREAEESMGNGNPPMVEMSSLHTISGRPETFTIPDHGIYEQDSED